jgi:hypothetical protein
MTEQLQTFNLMPGSEQGIMPNVIVVSIFGIILDKKMP